MIKRNQKLINILNMLSDGMIIFLSYYIALFIRFVVLGGKSSLLLWKFPYSMYRLVFSAGAVFVYYALGMYGSFRFKKVGSENISILSINGVLTVMFMAFLFVIRLEDFSRGVLFLYWAVSSLAIILKRAFVRKTLHYFRKRGYNQKHVIIIGGGATAAGYVRDIRSRPHLGITIDGHVSPRKMESSGRYLGTYENLADILDSADVDEIVVALEPAEMGFMKHIITCADKEGVRLSLVPFFNEYFSSYVQVEKIGRTNVIDMRATPLDDMRSAVIKRLVDIAGSLLCIIIFSPVMAVAAIGVKLSSPGPVIFRQERIGLHKKKFYMYKFRSMRVNVRQETGWTTDRDPRKTKFGSIIRKFSIDELPQLFNVLKGDMSLVGPRPEVPHYVRQFKEDIPLYLLRQQVKPGITGWAQVNGLRGDTSIEERVKYDIWYIENWSLWLDIRILLKTAFGGWINSEKISG